jgi:DNA-3-methyladenine glycosylase I
MRSASERKPKKRARPKVAAAVVRHADGRTRCAWCGDDPLYVAYHDTEWGRPSRDDRYLFEMLCLEGAQAGLSWLIVLRKREHYRKAFDHFDARRMARYGVARQARLLLNPGIVRNRLKVAAFVANARAYLELLQQEKSFADFLQPYAASKRRRRPRGRQEMLAETEASAALSRELKRRGFRFVGSTICYAFMQAVGLVDDHQARCFVARRR